MLAEGAVLADKAYDALLESFSVRQSVQVCCGNGISTKLARGVRLCDSGRRGTNDRFHLILQNLQERCLVLLIRGSCLCEALRVGCWIDEALRGKVCVTELEGFSQSIDLASKFANVKVVRAQL